VRAIDYAIRQAWASLWRSRAATAFAVAAIALAMIVLGALLLITSNAERLLAEWSSAAEFSVYLRDDATSEQRGAIEALLDQSGVTAGREYVSKTQALSRFRREFAELASLTSAFPDNPFPASLEVQVKPEADQDGRATALVQKIAALPGVADVRYDREWLARFASAVATIRAAGLALVLIMTLAAGLTVAAVVRLGLFARRAEIEIMELVGAPLAFIRGPFIAEGLLQGGIGAAVALALLWAGYWGARTCAEGLLQGGIGAAVALALLWAGYWGARTWWAPELSGLLLGGDFGFLPIRMWVSLVAGGMAVGSAGGFAASRHAG
jgi:cell division transport system permease protein